MKKYITLIKGDYKNIIRDPVLIATIVGPFMMGLFLKYAVPFLNQLLLEQMSFELRLYNELIMGMFIMLCPMLIGSMTGFMLLEDHEEGLLQYYATTPLSKSGFLTYRLVIPIILNIGLSYYLVYFPSLISVNILLIVPIILLASLQSIMISLLLVVVCENRVEGLAITKGLGILFIVPIIDHLFDFKLNFILGIFPTYWIPKLIEISNQMNHFTIVLILGFLIYLLYIKLLLIQFHKKTK